jgi:lysyl-tRNA synthetase class 2
MSRRLAAHAIDTPLIPRGPRIDRERHHKLQQLRARGHEPYPHAHLPQRSLAAQIYAAHDPQLLGAGEHHRWRYVVAGRLVARRKHRHATFLDLRDQSGVIELCVTRSQLDQAQCSQILTADIGDIVTAAGTVYVTNNRKLTLAVTSSKLLSKALRSPPVSPSGATGRDARYAQPELDLLANEQTRLLFKARSSATQAIRHWMARNSFIEVESPVLQPSSHANAQGTFVTHSSAMGRDLALRTSNRLYLRRCLLGGLERVYELGKCFRDDTAHRQSPELTVLEWAAAYVDAHELANQAAEMIEQMAQSVLSHTNVQWRGNLIDLGQPWRATTLRECIIEHRGLDVLQCDRKALAEHLRTQTNAPDRNWGALVSELYSVLVLPQIVAPTIVYDPPLAGHVLAKRHREHRELASGFGLVIGGVEVASGNSELNDPQEQRARFTSQEQLAWNCSSDQEVRLLEYGLCPAVSAKLSVDQVVMLLTGRNSVSDAIAFPLAPSSH